MHALGYNLMRKSKKHMMILLRIKSSFENQFAEKTIVESEQNITQARIKEETEALNFYKECVEHEKTLRAGGGR